MGVDFMSSVRVSVIIPTRNVAENIANIIKAVSKNCIGLDVEYLIIDMNSTDSTIRNALNAIKANKLNGFVLQNGNSTVGSALNTGIYKASGKYISQSPVRKRSRFDSRHASGLYGHGTIAHHSPVQYEHDADHHGAETERLVQSDL